MASPIVSIAKAHTLSTGPSSSHTFKDAYFDYNFARFLGLCSNGGAETAECFETASRITDGDVEIWTEAWTTTAQRVEAIAEEAFKGGHRISAKEAWLRATTYYQAAFFFVKDQDPRKEQLYQKHTTCFQSAGALFSPPLEILAIPYEGRTLFGYFLRPNDTEGPRPTVLIQMGADGSSEQIYFSGGGAAAVRRGFNALIFEGPGQTGTFMRDRTLHYRYDWEVPVKAVVDFAVSKPEVDAEKIVLIAYSLGGYYGPRAAAFEKRLAGLVVSDLVPSVSEMNKGRVRQLRAAKGQYKHSDEWLLFEHMPKHGLNNGLDDLDKLEAGMEKMTLYGLENQITCPLLVVQAEAEGAEETRRAQDFFEKLPNPKNRFRLTTSKDAAEMHCQKGNALLLHAIEFDWIEDILGGLS